MGPNVLNTLREWKLRCPAGELGLVFPNGRGKVENLANITNRFFAPLQVEAGTVDQNGKPKYGLHALRHFFASWLIDQDFKPKRVQELMGHSSIGVTMDVYGHLFPGEDDYDKFAAAELQLLATQMRHGA